MQNKKRSTSALKTLKRILSIILKRYWPQLLLVFLCIIITSFSTVYGTSFTQKLIDDIIPELQKKYSETGKSLGKLSKSEAKIYLLIYIFLSFLIQDD